MSLALRKLSQILAGLKSRFEEHHELKYSQSALTAAVELSATHINDKYLPDKAIDVIDEAGARIRLSDGRQTVGEQDIQKVISQIAKIPEKSISVKDRALGKLEEDLKRVIFGQDPAINKLASSIMMSRARKLGNDEKPNGPFFSGPIRCWENSKFLDNWLNC